MGQACLSDWFCVKRCRRQELAFGGMGRLCTTCFEEFIHGNDHVQDANGNGNDERTCFGKRRKRESDECAQETSSCHEDKEADGVHKKCSPRGTKSLPREKIEGKVQQTSEKLQEDDDFNETFHENGQLEEDEFQEEFNENGK